MFRGKKEQRGTSGPYRVDKIIGASGLQNLLNTREAEGYELVQIIADLLQGTNNGRTVIFKKRGE